MLLLVERDLQRVEPSPLVPRRPLRPPAGLRSADADAEHGHRAAVESLYREGDRLIATTLRQDVQERQVVLGGRYGQRGVLTKRLVGHHAG
jgi:hypothetical protein